MNRAEIAEICLVEMEDSTPLEYHPQEFYLRRDNIYIVPTLICTEEERVSYMAAVLSRSTIHVASSIFAVKRNTKGLFWAKAIKHRRDSTLEEERELCHNIEAIAWGCISLAEALTHPSATVRVFYEFWNSCCL